MNIDNKIGFIGGWILTTASTITLMGAFKAAFLGLIGGFFGLFGKEVYYYVRTEVNNYLPKLKAKTQQIKAKVQSEKAKVKKTFETFVGKSDRRKHEK